MDISLKSTETLEFNKIKDELSKFAKFEQSKRLCQNAKLFNEALKIEEQLNLTNEAKQILDYAKDTPTEYIGDISRIRANSAVTYLSEIELIDIAKTMKSSRLLKKFITENSDDEKATRKSWFGKNGKLIKWLGIGALALFGLYKFIGGGGLKKLLTNIFGAVFGSAKQLFGDV